MLRAPKKTSLAIESENMFRVKDESFPVYLEQTTKLDLVRFGLLFSIVYTAFFGYWIQTFIVLLLYSATLQSSSQKTTLSFSNQNVVLTSDFTRPRRVQFYALLLLIYGVFAGTYTLAISNREVNTDVLFKLLEEADLISPFVLNFIHGLFDDYSFLTLTFKATIDIINNAWFALILFNRKSQRKDLSYSHITSFHTRIERNKGRPSFQIFGTLLMLIGLFLTMLAAFGFLLWIPGMFFIVKGRAKPGYKFQIRTASGKNFTSDFFVNRSDRFVLSSAICLITGSPTPQPTDSPSHVLFKKAGINVKGGPRAIYQNAYRNAIKWSIIPMLLGTGLIIYGTSKKYSIPIVPMLFILFVAFLAVYLLLGLPRSIALGQYQEESLASNNNYVAHNRRKQIRYMNLRNVRSVSVSQGKYRSRSFENLRFGETSEITGPFFGTLLLATFVFLVVDIGWLHILAVDWENLLNLNDRENLSNAAEDGVLLIWGIGIAFVMLSLVIYFTIAALLPKKKGALLIQSSKTPAIDFPVENQEDLTNLVSHLTYQIQYRQSKKRTKYPFPPVTHICISLKKFNLSKKYDPTTYGQFYFMINTSKVPKKLFDLTSPENEFEPPVILWRNISLDPEIEMHIKCYDRDLFTADDLVFERIEIIERPIDQTIGQRTIIIEPEGDEEGFYLEFNFSWEEKRGL
ncbi:MAG: hypothetical protein ACTSYA_00685 [Candidatus Kariarchaeaceae archaeon]